MTSGVGLVRCTVTAFGVTRSVTDWSRDQALQGHPGDLACAPGSGHRSRGGDLETAIPGWRDRGQVVERHVGTDDVDPGDNMVKVEDLVYDAGNDGGDGHLTKRTLYVIDGTTDKRETTYTHDVRGRVLLETNPVAPHAFHKVDNQGNRLATGLFSSTASITVSSDDPTTETTNRLALTEWAYDDLGQLWKTTRHKIDVADGSDDDTLLDELWRDQKGRVIKEDGSQLTKTFFDRLGKVSHRFVLAEVDDTVYADADDVTGDFVLEESQSLYDPDSDDLLMSLLVQREHDDFGGGATTGALDTNADADDLLVTAANLAGRPEITAFWYDRFGRQTDQVSYGTYGGSNFDRDGLSAPARSDTALRTSYSYATDGTLQDMTDPRALVTRQEYDEAGRQTKVIRNYEDGTPSGTDSDQTVAYQYTDGLRTKITADLPAGSTDQDTIYTYGTAGGSGANSDIATGHLLFKAQYPDSSGGTDVVTYAYNAQSEVVYLKDQAGNIIETDLDDGGRQEHRRITTLDGDFDGAVRRISTTFDNLGRAQLVTQWDNAAVGSGAVTDEVKYTYDGWSGVTSFEQDRNSAVGAGTPDDYEISYAYEKATGGRNTIRRSSMTLPSGNVITFTYSDTNAKDGKASRVTNLLDGGVGLVAYKYLGAGTVVGTAYPQPDLLYTRYAASNYDRLDRFGRVIEDAWETNLATDISFYEYAISWDRNSNITRTEDAVHTGFDVLYTMDEIDRLVDAQEGTWNGSSITSETRQQEWTLSHTGNWDLGKLDLNGDGDWGDADEYQDARTHNAVNELLARDTDNDSTDDFTLVYDEDGNLIDDGEDYKYVYDPFGRLRKVKNQANTVVAEYRYNGLGFQISRLEDTDDDGDADGSDTWFHTAFDEAWRGVATFRADDTSPKEEFVNHLAGDDGYGGSSYINGVVCRDKDNTEANWLVAADGTLEYRFYTCQNWRGDVVALINSDGAQVEHARYTSYGVPIGMPGADTDSDGDCDSTDITQIQTWIDAPSYDVRGDVDLDGDVDATDKSTAQGWLLGKVHGWEVLGSEGNLKAHQGSGGLCSSRLLAAQARVQSIRLGLWTRRDAVEYSDGYNMYLINTANPVRFHDPEGLRTQIPGEAPDAAGSGIEYGGDITSANDACEDAIKSCYDCINNTTIYGPFLGQWPCEVLKEILNGISGDWVVSTSSRVVPRGNEGKVWGNADEQGFVKEGGDIASTSGGYVMWHELRHAKVHDTYARKPVGYRLGDVDKVQKREVHDGQDGPGPYPSDNEIMEDISLCSEYCPSCALSECSAVPPMSPIPPGDTYGPPAPPPK